ncbi:hypothetical protein SPLC1_S411640 [Arthrospira platensis C1]|nr:hypothetical protein SPLC1_S411640 [Arthrospira platensis C1]
MVDYLPKPQPCRLGQTQHDGETVELGFVPPPNLLKLGKKAIAGLPYAIAVND